jgi:hypothetical protein
VPPMCAVRVASSVTGLAPKSTVALMPTLQPATGSEKYGSPQVPGVSETLRAIGVLGAAVPSAVQPWIWTIPCVDRRARFAPPRAGP